MANTATTWKHGRGKLGLFAPLLGVWQAEGDSPQGPVRCTRTFAKVLAGAYVQLTAVWAYADKSYEEIALFGVGEDGRIGFTSFTSDGKRSTGELVEAADLPPGAIAFEAQMPAGLARQAYWPAEGGGFHWAVESKTRQGWNRFVEHLYSAAHVA